MEGGDRFSRAILVAAMCRLGGRSQLPIETSIHRSAWKRCSAKFAIGSTFQVTASIVHNTHVLVVTRGVRYACAESGSGACLRPAPTGHGEGRGP
jgi:hypothetical protein